MSKIINTCTSIAIFSLLLTLSSNAYSAWDSADIKEIEKKLKNNESFSDYGDPSISQQIIIQGKYINYIIDFTVKDCFTHRWEKGGASPYSCKKIKEGFPIFTPLITWE